MQRVKFWFKNHDYSWKYKMRVCFPLVVGLIAIDWLAKFAVMKSMKYGSSETFIPKFLRLSYVINLGSAKGANSDNLTLSISLATVFTLLILVVFVFANSRKWMISLSFINGGSLGNLLGRSWSPKIEGLNTRGGVIDFLQWDFDLFNSGNYIFNLADVFVILGSILLALFLIMEIWRAIKKPNQIKPPTKRDVVREQNHEAN